MPQPILLIIDSGSRNALSGYICEILDVEGIVCRETLDLASEPLKDSHLAGRDMVILAHVNPEAKSQSLLAEFVASGGNLIAFRPPPDMLGIFGLKPTSGIVRHFAEGYVTLAPKPALLAQIQADCLQFHGDADLYEPDSATVLAALAGKPGVRTRYPAIVLHEHGKGLAAAFAYDLAASNVLFHQGTPLNSSLGPNPDPDRDLAYKTCDLFYRYLDERLKTIPQADIHQDILVCLIRRMTERRPMPRLWHFPHAAPAAAFLDGDSDSMPTADLESVIEIIERFAGKYTLYLMTKDFKALTPERMRELLQRGHDLGPHLFAGRMPSPQETLANMRVELAELRKHYEYQPVAHRGHSVVWVGWTEHAKYLHENGLRLDSNIYPGAGYQHGYCSGSALPVKFMDEKGRLVDVYEQATLSSEDVLLSDKALLPAMTLEQAIELSLGQIDDLADKFHGVYHPCFHPVYVNHKSKCSAPWIEAVARRAHERGLPFVNGREWVEFNDARRGVQIQNLSFDNQTGVLRFDIRSLRAVSGLTLLLPANFKGRRVRLEGFDQTAIVLNLGADETSSITVKCA